MTRRDAITARRENGKRLSQPIILQFADLITRAPAGQDPVSLKAAFEAMDRDASSYHKWVKGKRGMSLAELLDMLDAHDHTIVIVSKRDGLVADAVKALVERIDAALNETPAGGVSP